MFENDVANNCFLSMFQTVCIPYEAEKTKLENRRRFGILHRTWSILF